jgi:glycosyltransferase involved in cell wall biosynthesis
MSKIYILNPYGTIGGGSISQFGLKKSLDGTGIFEEVVVYNIFSRKERLKSILKIIFKLNSNNSDYVIMQGIFEIEYILFDLLLLKKDKTIIIPRGAYVPTSNNSRIVKNSILKRILWRLFINNRLNSTALWVPTSYLEQVRLLQVGANKINSVIIPDFFNGNERFINESENPSDFILENYFLFVGRISIEKNILFLIDLFYKLSKKFNNYKLLILGPADDQAYFNKVKKRIIELELNEKVIIKFKCTQAELISYYNNSKLILLTSYIESLGLIVLEAIFLKKYIFISENVPFDLNGTSLGETLKLDEILWVDRISNFIMNNNHTINLDKRNQILNDYNFEKIKLLWKNNFSRLLNL